jgi:hypothetical protein
MLFESYEEALGIARTAAGVIARCAHGRTSEKSAARPQERYRKLRCITNFKKRALPPGILPPCGKGTKFPDRG